jgi:uncharacterized OsmC-like protein
MLGTFGGASDRCQRRPSHGGRDRQVETDEGVLVIRRIHVTMRLAAPEHTRPTVDRVHGIYAMRCPLYRTLHHAIALSSSVELVARTIR